MGLGLLETGTSDRGPEGSIAFSGLCSLGFGCCPTTAPLGPLAVGELDSRRNELGSPHVKYDRWIGSPAPKHSLSNERKLTRSPGFPRAGASLYSTK